jgi:hypothetical protein
MKANRKNSITSKNSSSTYVPSKAYQKYARSASSFWADTDFDTSFKVGSNLDFTKLAATQRAIGNFVNIVTGQQIPVVFQSSDNSYTDGKSVVIGTKLDSGNFDPAVGLALHEGSHIAYTDFTLFNHEINNSPTSDIRQTRFATIVRDRLPDTVGGALTADALNTIKSLLNWIEDRRIDYKIYTTAPGYRMYYEAMYNKYFNDKVIDKALVTNEKTQETWDDYLFHVINFTNPNRRLDSLKQLRKVWDVIDLKNIHRLQTTTDALHVATDVFTLIREACLETQLSEIQDIFDQNSDADGTNGSSEGDGDGSQEMSIDIESQPADSGEGSGSNSSMLSDKEKKKLEDVIKQQNEFIEGQQKKTGKLTKTQNALVRALKESGTETRIVSTAPDNSAGTMGDVTAVVVKKLTREVICSMPSLFHDYASEHMQGKTIYSSYCRRIEATHDAVITGIILGKQLGNKLQLRNADRSLKTTRLQTGKIDRRLISQLGYNNVNVFHKIVTDKFKNYFIHISIDASGSMSGEKMLAAIKSAVAIAQAASMTTGIRVQISFRGTDNISSNTEKCVTVYAYDSAHDKMTKIKNLFKYLDTFGCTPEGVAFKSIEKDIQADAKGDELIFINYSDGAPSPVQGMHRASDPVTFTKNVVNGMRSYGFNIISYFINQPGYDWAGDGEKKSFKTMYGPDSQFINPVNMSEISKSINSKFLEIAK